MAVKPISEKKAAKKPAAEAKTESKRVPPRIVRKQTPVKPAASQPAAETGMDPAKAGAYIASVAMREGHHHPLYAIRFDYKFFTFLAKVLPARFLNWLIYCLYGK